MATGYRRVGLLSCLLLYGRSEAKMYVLKQKERLHIAMIVMTLLRDYDTMMEGYKSR